MYFQRGESLLKFLRFYIKTYLNRYSHERTIMVKYERFKVYICIKADWSISRNIQLILSWHVKLSLEMGNVFFLLFTIDIISVKDGHSRNHNKNNIFSKLKEFIYYAFLISYRGYCCDSDMALCNWSPFNMPICFCWKRVVIKIAKFRRCL